MRLDWIEFYNFESKYIAQKIEDLHKIISYHEKMSRDQKENVWKIYPKGVQNLIERYYSKNWTCPKSHGEWTGERGNSIFIPDSNYKPSNTNMSNPDNLYWKDILAKYNINGIKFYDYEVDFSSVVYDSITLQDCRDCEFVRYKEEDLECGLHDKANEIITKKWLSEGKIKGNTGNDIAEARAIIESKNLCWHECLDCKTLQLVPREIHHNIKHFGGIAMAKIVHG